MDTYIIYANIKEGVDAKDFSIKMNTFLSNLVSMKKMISFRILRMKLGFRSMDMPEFCIIMNFKNLQELDDAMTSIIRNDENIEESHVAFNQLVDPDTIHHFLYRDYPDDIK